MSTFTDASKARAIAAWKLTTAWPASYAKWREKQRRQSFGSKASNGCLGFLFFGFAVILVPIMIFTVVEVVVVVYASLLSLVWVLAAVVGKFNRRKLPSGD